MPISIGGPSNITPQSNPFKEIGKTIQSKALNIMMKIAGWNPSSNYRSTSTPVNVEKIAKNAKPESPRIEPNLRAQNTAKTTTDNIRAAGVLRGPNEKIKPSIIVKQDGATPAEFIGKRVGDFNAKLMNANGFENRTSSYRLVRASPQELNNLRAEGEALKKECDDLAKNNVNVINQASIIRNGLDRIEFYSK